jgi:predicted Rossmann fold nucleotide-binding protein DprA/Smf involved in DNA uptake
VEVFFMTGRQALAYLALKYKGDWDKMIQGVRNHEDVESEEAEKELSAIHCSFLTIVDKDYPESLRNCYRPPLVLFYYGDISLVADEARCVSYIGSREASAYGLERARTIAGGLAKEGYVIVTGLARGIDAAANQAALEAQGKTVGVLGCGIDLCYPASSQPLYDQLKQKGLLLSEYPGEVPPFPAEESDCRLLQQRHGRGGGQKQKRDPHHRLYAFGSDKGDRLRPRPRPGKGALVTS